MARRPGDDSSMAGQAALNLIEAANMAVTLQITSLGAQGDGVAEHDGRKIFVPSALPGETVSADIAGDRAINLEVLNPAPDRAGPRCSHYGACGGCALQHLPDQQYLDFKRGQVVQALSFQRIEAVVDPIVPIEPYTRRRAVFAATRVGRNVVVGFHGRRSHRIVGVEDCAVITPGLMKLNPALKMLAAVATPTRDGLVITATETATGFDVALTGVPKTLSADDRAKVIKAASDCGLARVSINGEVAIELTPPTIRLGSAHLIPPPGGFLQACEASEAAMLHLVSQAVGDARKVVDLFAGAGTFSLPLASTATLHAVESDAAALGALLRAARKAPNLKPVTIEQRDLFRRPLSREELKSFDAAVIDPPRAGAPAQTRELAASSLKRIAMISCNAQTFATDLRVLLDGGFRVRRIVPIDQFLWSPHIEIVATLEK